MHGPATGKAIGPVGMHDMDTHRSSSSLSSTPGKAADVRQTVRRTLLCVALILPVLFSGALAGRGAHIPTGTVAFHGRVIDPQAPFALGSLVTVRAIVIDRADACTEVRVLASGPSPQPLLWLCAPSVQGANRLPDAGGTILARVRITRIEAAIPFSDSFILLQANKQPVAE